MRSRKLLFTALMGILLASLSFIQTQKTTPPVVQAAPLLQNTPDGSLMFVENVGQFDERARFQVSGGSGTLWLAEDALWMTVIEQPQAAPPENMRAAREDSPLSAEPRQLVNLKLSFPGANPSTGSGQRPRLEPFNPLDTAVHYYKGNDSSQWQTNVPVWGGVRYVDIYPGVDLEITGVGGHWVWQLVTRHAARSTPNVRLRVEGAESIIVEDGYLHLITTVGDIALPLLTTAGSAPLGEPVTTRVADHTFEIAAPFSTLSSATLAAPENLPEEIYFGTYLGGSDIDVVTDLVVEGTGDILDRTLSVYVTGRTQSTDFPTEPGGSTTLNGDKDAFVTKLRKVATLVKPEYSAYIGGSYTNTAWGSADGGNGIAVDENGVVYITGQTNSADFPVTPNAFDTTFNGEDPCGGYSPDVTCTDAFVLKLDSSGNLLYSTFLGGTGTSIPGSSSRGHGNDQGVTIAVKDGIIYLAGNTGAEDFPTTDGAYDRVFADVNVGLNDDVFVVKLNPASTGTADLLYATFVGGGTDSTALDFAVDDAGIVYVTGFAEGDIFPVNSDFPITPGAIDSYLWMGDWDAFFFKLDPAGNGTADLLYSTFLGGDEFDQGHGIAVDASGMVYLTGYTGSANFLTTPDAFDTVCGSDGKCNYISGWGPYLDAFVSKINPAGNGTADLLYSTFLGGNDFDNAWEDGDIALGADGDVYVTGETRSADFPLSNIPYDDTISSYYDVFVTRLRLLGNGADDLVYSTYVGGYGSDAGNAIAVAEDGGVYVAGKTQSSNFPVTQSAFDSILNGSRDIFVFRLLPVNTTTSEVDAYIQAPTLAGALPAGNAAIGIQYGNTGLITANSVVLTATWGISLTYVGDTSGIVPTQVTTNTYSWNLPDLPFDNPEQFILWVSVPNAPIGTRYPVTLTLTSTGSEADTSNNTVNLEVMVARQVYLPLIWH